MKINELKTIFTQTKKTKKQPSSHLTGTIPTAVLNLSILWESFTYNQLHMEFICVLA